MKSRFAYIGTSIAICLLVGTLSTLALEGSLEDWYPDLEKPAFTLPDQVFAPVWIMFYLLMGISAGLVWARGYYHIWVKTALYHFVFQLLLSVLWTLVFFGLKKPFWGLLVILALLTLIFLTIKWFRIISRPAAFLLWPYALWVAYVAVLNYAIWTLNP